MTDLSDDDFRDLIERSHLLDELEKHPGWELYVDRARHTLGQRQHQILYGNVVDMEHYKKLRAFVEGATFVLGIPGLVRAEVEVERGRRRDEEPGGEAA